MNIKVIDFGAVGLGTPEPSAAEMERISREIITAFGDIGFVYLKNTGIEDQAVFKVMDISKNFFQLPKDIKQQYARIVDSEIPSQGWIESERLNSTKCEELKEVFNLTSLSESHNWPVDHAPEFTRSMESFYKACQQLSVRILKIIALGLGLESDFFTSKHKRMGSNPNLTTLRTAYYPPIQKSSVKENQVRCGEHSDYGTFTLLFQDKNGGLEVMHKSGQFIAAPYIPNTLLLNIADTLQRWSSDTLISTKHRVQIPQSDDMMNKPRQSLAFFVHPDNAASLECYRGTNKYPAITSLQFLKENYGDLFVRDS
ncbi:uncharacterized protein si:dkey-10o6.2 isoform X1 [Stegostoma tigrinum]|uniref:uncharacterized protein si:dkey-10o6.2 isoform X1 n=1 Tax=Stegostoma tigrinum TaxID=3053191 RepID=UPI0028706CC1|nr:uncharacterized protein si:dkey-10o6.2 isoform X1 [Stegostoma tigrinum]